MSERYCRTPSRNQFGAGERDPVGTGVDNGLQLAAGEQAHSGKRKNTKLLIRQIWGRRVNRVRSPGFSIAA